MEKLTNTPQSTQQLIDSDLIFSHF